MILHVALPSLSAYTDRAEAFGHAGCDVTIWTPRISSRPPRSSTYVVRPVGPFNMRHPIAQRVLALRMLQATRERRPVVLWSTFGLLDSAFKIIGNNRSAVRVHHSVSPLPAWFDDHVLPPSSRDAELTRHRIRALRREARSMRLADVVVVQARAHAYTWSRATGIPIDRFEVLPNAVAARQRLSGDPQVRSQCSGPPTFVFAGNLRRFKGVFDLLEAFSSVRANRGDCDPRLLFVGRAPDQELRHQLSTQIQEAGLHDAVSIRPPLSQIELFDLLGSCSALVHPSYFEGMPRVVLEAMDVGVPVIASRIPGIHDLDTGERVILFHKAGSASSLASRMHEVLDEPDMMAARVLAGQAVVADRHRPERIGVIIKAISQAAIRRATECS